MTLRGSLPFEKEIKRDFAKFTDEWSIWNWRKVNPAYLKGKDNVADFGSGVSADYQAVLPTTLKSVLLS